MDLTFSPSATAAILSSTQIGALRDALNGRLIALCFGSGVDSTAMMVALRVAGVRPHVITFADTGGEKPETLAHLDRMQAVLALWGWPPIDVVRTKTLPSTGYTTLLGNCLANETLPSLAFGMSSCSLKWKAHCQDQFLMGARSGPNARPEHPVWVEAKSSGQKVVKLIGYDCSKADTRRAKRVADVESPFDYVYPLQLLGWVRSDCVSAIARFLGVDMVPIKSACFFCPASKHWELYWLAAMHPELFEQALHMERVALTGRHSRFDAVEFGGKSWEEMVATSDRFPSPKTTVGLGRSFAWNQWARVNGVVDAEFRVVRARREEFLLLAKTLGGADNAFDARSCSEIPESEVEAQQLRELEEALA